jgi:hypothetical protein
MTGASINEPSCFSFLTRLKGRPAGWVCDAQPSTKETAPASGLGAGKVSCVPFGNSERHGERRSLPLVPGWRLVWGETRRPGPRERKDLPWILAAFAVLIVVMTGGAIFRWL